MLLTEAARTFGIDDRRKQARVARWGAVALLLAAIGGGYPVLARRAGPLADGADGCRRIRARRRAGGRLSDAASGPTRNIRRPAPRR